MNFVSSVRLAKKSQKQRINYILNMIRDGSILIVDGVMSSDEELNLIRETMRRITNGFPGIEVCSLKRQNGGYLSFIDRLVENKERVQKLFSHLTGGEPPITGLRTGITVIGPAQIIRKIKKNPDSFFVLAEV